jgi:carboxypeptidase family protein
MRALRALTWGACLLPVLLLLSCASSYRPMPMASGAKAVGTISIEAWTDWGALAGATVRVVAPDKKSFNQVTDMDGRAVFTVPPYKRYEVTVEYLGLETRRMAGVDVIEGRTTTLAVVLRHLTKEIWME